MILQFIETKDLKYYNDETVIHANNLQELRHGDTVEVDDEYGRKLLTWYPKNFRRVGKSAIAEAPNKMVTEDAPTAQVIKGSEKSETGDEKPEKESKPKERPRRRKK